MRSNAGTSGTLRAKASALHGPSCPWQMSWGHHLSNGRIRRATWRTCPRSRRSFPQVPYVHGRSNQSRNRILVFKLNSTRKPPLQCSCHMLNAKGTCTACCHRQCRCNITGCAPLLGFQYTRHLQRHRDLLGGNFKAILLHLDLDTSPSQPPFHEGESPSLRLESLA